MRYLTTKLFFVSICFITLFAPNRLFGQDEKYRYEASYVSKFHSDITVNNDGEINITEKYDVYFNEQSRGIFRYIPLMYEMTDQNGNVDKIRVKIKDISVTGDAFVVEDNNRYSDRMYIRIGDPNVFLTGPKTYTISYTIKNAILFNDTSCIFYWNLIGNDWDMPFANASASVSFSPSLNVSDVKYYVYTGQRGEGNNDAISNFENGKINIVSTQEIGGLSKRDITVLAYLPKSYIAPPNPILLWLASYYWFLIAIATSLYFYITWKNHGKDNRIIDTVEYLPPAEIDSAIAGFMIDESADNHDIISLLPFWGSMGLIKIIKDEKSEITLHKLKDLNADAPSYQRVIFNKIFENGKTIRPISELKAQFATTLKDSKDNLKHECLMDYYTPESLKLQNKIALIYILLAIFGAGFIAYFTSIMGAITFFTIHLVLALCAGVMKKKSTRGDEILRITRGFRMFIDKAEKKQIEFYLKEDPLYFDKTIAFAIAFGMAKKWAEHFKGLTLQEPDWYQDRSGSLNTFNAGLFAGSLMHSLNQTQSTMSFVPPPADSGSGGFGGGGGFSGGGFSGGGFGGGGGGRW